MAYDNPVIDEVKNANDIVDVIGEYVRLKKNGANYFGLCPFHLEKTPSFSVSPKNQMYYCFGCGAGGDVFRFLMQYENLSFGEALRELADRAHISLPEQNVSEEYKKRNELRDKLLEINKTAAYFFVAVLHSKKGSAGYDYLKNKRGLTDGIIKHFGLGFSPEEPDALFKQLKARRYSDELIKQSGLVIYGDRNISDRFRGRVIFPIMDTNNKVTGFGGRVMGDGLPKYLNSPETLVFDKSRSIYALNFAKKSRQDFLILCEGYMDVIALHQYGFTNAVASLGTALNNKHATVLKRYTDKIILCQDSDEAGTNAKIRAFPILHEAGIDTRVISLKDAKDPDEFLKKHGRESFEELIKDPENAFIYIIGELKKNFDLKDPAEKTSFYHELAERLTMFKEPLERGNYIDSVCSSFFIDRDELKDLVDKKMDSNKRQGVRSKDLRKEREPVSKDNAKASIDRLKQEEKNERLLVLWLLRFPDIKEKVFKVIDPGEMIVPVYSKIASDLKDSKDEDISGLMDGYHNDENAQRLIAALLSELEIRENDTSFSRPDLEKGVTEAVRKLKMSALEEKIKENKDDIGMVSRLLRERNSLAKLKIFGCYR